jgi:hypothetical protein
LPASEVGATAEGAVGAGAEAPLSCAGTATLAGGEGALDDETVLG